jgi:signal transduction histidine kinase
MIGRRGTRRQVQVTGATLPDGDFRFSGFLGIFIDVTASQKRELELRQTQKMEAVGRLASGIAHEINTPIQFAGDSIQFLRDALQEVEMLIARYREALASDPSALAQQREQLLLLEQDLDLEYLQEQMPKAIERSLEGLNRVSAIVRAMKTFAHPDDGRKGHVDLNQALLNTLTIARNEYKYVADVVTDLGDLPLVLCNLSELNHVFLNLLVNAAHAIGEKARQQPNFRGVIQVTTRVDGDHVAVTISDTGIGIPAAIRHKVFDPFFTTKPVGRGTGQGLTIAHAVIERHGGTISFTTNEGEGASFTIRLPIHGVSPSHAEDARA